MKSIVYSSGKSLKNLWNFFSYFVIILSRKGEMKTLVTGHFPLLHCFCLLDRAKSHRWDCTYGMVSAFCRLNTLKQTVIYSDKSVH